MGSISNKLKLHRVGNEIIDLAGEWNIDIIPIKLGQAENGQDIVGIGIKDRDDDKNKEVLPFRDIERTAAYRRDLPPADWDEFLAQTTDIFVEKDTDYRHKYTRGLIEHGRVIWEWEVDKKLDRIRTWIERGELMVKGEGLNNAVSDLFNYTVLYILYKKCLKLGKDPIEELTEANFYATAGTKAATEWIEFIADEGLIKPDERDVRGITFKYMGVA